MWIKKEKPETISKSKLMYDSKLSFSNYSNIGTHSDLSFMTKHKLVTFYHWLNEFRNLFPWTEK